MWLDGRMMLGLDDPLTLMVNLVVACPKWDISGCIS